MKYSFSLLGLAAVASAEWTSIFNITATPDQVINPAGMPAPGQPGAIGQFNYALDSKTNTICYDITLKGVSGTYQAAARTATHIHQGLKGKAGPPRIAFPNPVGDDTLRRSVGCLTGPFVTGIKAADNITDTGAGFTLSQIEADPAGFFTDSHTNLFVPGVVRGQLDQSYKIIKDKEDGSAITTATLTATDVITVTKCPPTVTKCPYAPVVTTTVRVYTTICPISELPTHTKSYAPHETKTYAPHETKTYAPHETKSYSPPETHVVAPTKSAEHIITRPHATGTGAPVQPTTSKLPEFTGAASANKVGGLMMAAGLVAALL